MKKATSILKALQVYYPTIRIALNYTNNWELLVATILSAQCTDVRVNMITENLFKKYKTISDYAKVSQVALEKDVHSAGFFRNKAKNIIASANRVMDVYGGEVPDTMADLLNLPGAARKTSNIFLYNGFGKNEGIAIDTHVQRIVQLLGLTVFPDPKRIEQDLMKLFPRKDWGDVNHRLVQYGRDVCVARRPQCGQCVLTRWCNDYQMRYKENKGKL